MPDSRAHDTQVAETGQGKRPRPARAEKRAARVALRRGAAPSAPALQTLHESAMAAHAVAEYGQAMEKWAALRAAEPNAASGYVWGVLSAKAAGHEAAAREIAEAGSARLPRFAKTLRDAAAAPAWEAADSAWPKEIGGRGRDRKAALHAALLPLKQAALGKTLRQELALARLKVLQQKYRKSQRVQTAILSMLIDMGRYEAAASLAGEYAAAAPDNTAIVLSQVTALDKLERYADAYAAIAALRGRVTPDPAIEVAHSLALSRLGQLDAAEAACAEALAAFPDSLDVAREYATLATRRGAWGEAIARWEAAEAKWPNKADIRRALKALRLLVVDQEAPRAAPEAVTDSAAIFARFESLGGTDLGCEFGIVQRHFGSVSLGLLRWSTIDVDGLRKGVRNGFAGLGDLDNVVISSYRSPAGREEYVVADRIYGFRSHTYISTKDAPADKMQVQTARRLTFMSGKLMEDLQAAEKIFVYKYEGARDEDAQAVLDALESHGPVTLLCVTKAHDGHEAGTVRQVHDRLIIGYVQSFAQGGAGTASIDYENWKSVCIALLARAGAAPALQEAEAQA